MKYIIFGGTFDPIHNGHLRMAEAASIKLDATVIFVPARSPRWKIPEETSNQRLDMLKLALKDAKFKYEISDYEIMNHTDINYSIDTVKYFKKIHPNDKLYFLIGADQVNQFPKWNDAKELSNLARFCFVNRPGIELNNKVIVEYNMLNLEYYESGEVSSSDIREIKSVDLPFDVLEYIEINRLYFIKKLASYLPEKRLNHSIEVANLALKVAKNNNLDELNKYYFAALFHDLGKCYSKEDETTLSIMKKHFPDYCYLPVFSYHQFVGAFLAEKDFDIKDEEILDAIKYHCTGKANMSRLGMVVYACDKIEPTREFDSTWLINACLQDWKNGFLTTLKDNKKYLIEHGKDYTNNLTAECFNMYLE